MKKGFLTGILSLFITLIMISVSGCGTSNPSELNYWFSASNSYFVSYNDETNNLEEAGSYWEFTVAKNVDIKMNLRMNVNNYSSCAYLYVNDKQVQSETDTGIYTYIYNLSLKKGDKIKIHAKWVNSVSVDDEGFEIKLMSINYNGQQYAIREFNKTTTN